MEGGLDLKIYWMFDGGDVKLNTVFVPSGLISSFADKSSRP